jgi:hypothetical protein
MCCSALAGSERPWLSLVPMPTERIAEAANHFAARLAEDRPVGLVTMPVAQAPSAVAAFFQGLDRTGRVARRIIGPSGIRV